jgi:hypothetical protein
MKKFISSLLIFSLLESSCGWARGTQPYPEEDLGYRYTITNHKTSFRTVNHRGNIGKVVDDLTSSQNFKALAISMGTAGLTQGLLDKIGGTLTDLGLTAEISRTVIQTGVSTGVRVLTKDLSSREALAQMVVNAGVTVAGGFAAEGIGDLRFEHKIGWMTHKVLHGVLGATLGAASNLKHPTRGAAGGAMGAIIAEIVAENLPRSLGDRRIDIAALAAGIVAFFARQDVNAAGVAGTIAVEYNALKHADLSSQRPTLDKENYDVYQAGKTKPEDEFLKDYLALTCTHWPPSKNEFDAAIIRGKQIYNNIQTMHLGGATTPRGQVAEVFTDLLIAKGVGTGGKLVKFGTKVLGARGKAAAPVARAALQPTKKPVPPAAPKPKPNTTRPSGNKPAANPQGRPQTSPAQKNKPASQKKTASKPVPQKKTALKPVPQKQAAPAVSKAPKVAPQKAPAKQTPKPKAPTPPKKPASPPAPKPKPNATAVRNNKPAANPQGRPQGPPAAPATQKAPRNSPRAPHPAPVKKNTTPKSAQKSAPKRQVTPTPTPAAKPKSKPASEGTGFKGRKGFELKNPHYQKSRNTPAIINNREFSGHALDQMQNRGLTPSVVENAIKKNNLFPTRPGTSGYYDTINNFHVITNSKTGRIITVIWGRP